MHDPSKSSIEAIGRIPSEDHEALQSVACRAVRMGHDSMWQRAIQYLENAAYLRGNHLTRFFSRAGGGIDSMTHGIHDRSGYDHIIPKSVDNRLIRPVEAVTSMLTRTRPIPRMSPASKLPADEDAARMSEILIDVTFEHSLNAPARRVEAAQIGMICGTAIGECFYGDTDMAELVPAMKRKPVETPEGSDEGEETEEAEFEMVEEGEEATLRRDFQLDILTPLHVQPDPRATHEDNAFYFVRSSFEDIDWVIEQYKDGTNADGFFPDAIEEIQSARPERTPLYYWHEVSRLLDSPHQATYAGGMSQSQWDSHIIPDNMTLFSVIDVRPTLDHPKGRTLVVAGERLIYAGPSRSWSRKYPWRWHPYSFWRWYREAGSFWGVALLSQLLPLQRRINKLDMIMQLHWSFHAEGQWLIPHSSRVAEGKLAPFPGLQYTYRAVPGVPPPQRIDSPPMSPELYSEKQQCVEAMQFIAGTSRSDAVSPSANRADAMLTTLQKQQLEDKSPMLQGFEAFWEKIGQNVLIDAQLLLEVDQTLMRRLQVAARRESKATLENFSAESLRDHHAVKIDITSELSKTPEAMAERAMQAAQAFGQNLSPSDRAMLMTEMGFDDVLETVETLSRDRARRMIARAEQGEQPFAMPGIENTAVVVEELKKALLSDTANDLPGEVKTLLEQTLTEYQKIQAREQQQALERQMAMQQATEQAA